MNADQERAAFEAWFPGSKDEPRHQGTYLGEHGAIWYGWTSRGEYDEQARAALSPAAPAEPAPEIDLLRAERDELRDALAGLVPFVERPWGLSISEWTALEAARQALAAHAGIVEFKDDNPPPPYQPPAPLEWPAAAITLTPPPSAPPAAPRPARCRPT